MVKNLPAMRETRVQPLGREYPMKEMATHSSVVAWTVDRGAWWVQSLVGELRPHRLLWYGQCVCVRVCVYICLYPESLCCTSETGTTL